MNRIGNDDLVWTHDMKASALHGQQELSWGWHDRAGLHNSNSEKMGWISFWEKLEETPVCGHDSYN